MNAATMNVVLKQLQLLYRDLTFRASRRAYRTSYRSAADMMPDRLMRAGLERPPRPAVAHRTLDCQVVCMLLVGGCMVRRD